MADKLRVEVTAESAELKSGMDQAQRAVQDAVSGMESAFRSAGSGISSAVSSMQQAVGSLSSGISDIASGLSSTTGFFSPLTAAISAVTGAFAGLTAVFKGAASEEEKWVKDTLSLARGFGITTEEATALKVAIEDISAKYLTGEASTETMLNAIRRFSVSIAENEELLNSWGITTRNSNGEIKNTFDLFMEAVKHYQSLGGQIAKNADLMKLFGRGAADLKPILEHLSREGLEEAREKAEKLGITVGPEMLAKVQASSEASRNLHEQWQALSATLSQVAIPAWTAIKNVMAAVYELCNAIAKAIGSMIMKVWDLAQTAAKALDQLREYTTGEHTGPADADMWTGRPQGPPSLSTPHETSGGTPSPRKKDQTTEPAEKSLMPEWEAELKAKEVAEEAYFGLSLTEEKAFWEGKLAVAKAGTNDYRAVQNKVNEAIIKAGRESFEADEKNLKLEAGLQDQVAATTARRIETEIKLLNEGTAIKEKQVQEDYKRGQISSSQETAQLTALENERYAIEHAELLREIALYDENSKEFEAIQARELVAIQQHQQKLTQITNQGATQQQAVWNKLTSSIESAFATAFEGVVKGTQTLQQTMLKLVENIADIFLKMGEQMAMKWIEQQIMAALGAGAAKKTEAAATIPASAAEAAAGAAASQASIPVVGPELAMAAAAQMESFVMAFEGVASAAGGWDIPTGINPITQLHSGEMVLPKELADVIRGVAQGGQGGRGASGGSTSNQTFHINAIAPKDVAAAVKQAWRMGHR